jgi:ATP-binding cassette subfamily B protein
MAVIVSPSVSLSFAVIVPFLAIGLALIVKNAWGIFHAVFKKYDALNNSIQENVSGMRVVKTFVREEYETEKFNKASDDVCADFTRAEKILALNNPLMQFCMNGLMVSVSLIGSYTIIKTQGAALQVGELAALITYGVQILMSLMMLSMIIVMIAMSVASGKRITEVLTEKSSITSPENALTEVSDGSIVFENVSFKYSENAERFALCDIDLSIASGETVGIIGGTGSSKTSLIQLISRLYDVT